MVDRTPDQRGWSDRFLEWCPPVIAFFVIVPAFFLMMLAAMLLPPKWTGINTWKR